MATKTRVRKSDDDLKTQGIHGKVLFAVKKCYRFAATEDYKGTVLEVNIAKNIAKAAKPAKVAEGAKVNADAITDPATPTGSKKEKNIKQKLYLATKGKGWYWGLKETGEPFMKVHAAAKAALEDLLSETYSDKVKNVVNTFEALVAPGATKQYSASGLEDLVL